MSTCKKFYNSTQNNNKLWETKFYQRSWSANNKYNNNYNTKKRNKIFEQIDFKEEIKAGIKCINELRYYHSLMCINNLWECKANELNHLLYSTATKPMIYYFVIDDLYRILSQLSGLPDLTSTYHLGIIFRCLKLHRFDYKLKKFDRKPEKQLLEKLLIIIVQYFQPHVSYSGIRTWLNDIALEVLVRLRKKYRMHSIFLISMEQFYFWRDNNIYNNFCDQTEAKQIMYELEEFIFVELENHKLLHQFWKILNLEDEYVSENVQKYVLIITYHIILRRLGIRCNLVSYYGPNYEIYLRILWAPEYHLVRYDLLRNTMAFHLGKNFDNLEYLFLNEESHLLYPLNIVKGKLRDNEREARYFENFIIELMYADLNRYVTWNMLIKNTASKIIRLFYRQQMRKKPDCSWEYNIILNAMKTSFQKPNIASFVMESDASLPCNILTRSPRKRRKSKEQNDKMRFAVGMIVTHSSQIIVRDDSFHPYQHKFYSRHNYINNEYRLTNNHDGIIVGWDYSHRSFPSSNYPHLIVKNADNDMCNCSCEQSNGTNSLHYWILSENNVICYVSEDNISICLPKKINNMEIGRFFSEFEGTHYVPTKWLAEAYPEDTAALSKILLNQ